MLEIRPHDSLQKWARGCCIPLYSSPLGCEIGNFCRSLSAAARIIVGINPDMQCDLTLLGEPDHVHGRPVSPRSARPALSMGRWIANGDLLTNRSRNYSGTLLLVRRGPAPSTMSIQEVLWRLR